jgi:hypothetical protein
MDRSQQEWTDLCRSVKELIPKEIGEDAWYLIIVSKSRSSSNKYTNYSSYFSDSSIGIISRAQLACSVLYTSCTTRPVICIEEVPRVPFV